METVAAMECIATPGDITSEAHELIEIKATRTPPNGITSPERKASPINNEQSVIIEIDPSFFEKEIHDSKEDNYLRLLTDQFHLTKNQIQKVKENIFLSDNYVNKNKEAIYNEITRGTTYKFDEIDGDVTPESFQKGLIKIGVNKENQKALDFLMLFNLQNFGAASFGLLSSTLSLFNNLLKEKGRLVGAIDYHQFKQKISDASLSNDVTTEVTENITIKFASFYDASMTNVGEFKVVAEVDNSTLNYKFTSIRLIFRDKNCISLIEKYFNSIGFKRNTMDKPNEKQLFKTKISQGNEQNNHDASTCLPDYRLFPLTLNEQIELKKNPANVVASGNQLLPEYSGNSLAHDDTNNVRIEVPQTRLARQATLLLSSKKILEAVHQSIEESLRFSSKKKKGDEELLNEIGKAINILVSIERDMRALSSNDFEIKIPGYSQRLTQIILRIRKLSTADHAFLIGLPVGKSFNTMNNEIVLTHLNIVLAAFESSENFIIDLQHNAIERFIMLISECKKWKQIFSNDQQNDKGKDVINQDDMTVLDENKFEDVLTALHHNFINSFDYLKYDSSELEVPSNSSDFVLLSMQIRCAIAEIKQKNSLCNVRINELSKSIENLKSSRHSSRSKANLICQLERYKKISNCYGETVKILQNVLGEINCHFYTHDFEMKGLHPRNIFSGINTPDPLNASLDYKSYLTYQAKKLFDGSEQKYSIFDYILPWRWNNYHEKLLKDTYYQLNQAFIEENKSPRQKLIKMKHIIEENRPSRFNLFRQSERKKYDELKNHTYQLCLLDAFGQGYLTPTELSNEFLKYIKKKMPANHSQIKAYAEELHTQCKEFERTANREKMQELSKRLERYKLTSSAKAHTMLSNQNKDYAKLSDQVRREIESSSSSGSSSGSSSSLSSSSDNLEKLQQEEDTKLNILSTVSPDPRVISINLGIG